MIVVKIVLFCALFIGMVRISVISGAHNALYFYPKTYQKIAIERGIANQETISRKKKIFMIPFCTVMFVALVLIIGLWRKVTDFTSAYWQALLFLEVMNWFDGLVIDKLWVGKSSFWVISGMEGIPYVQTWGQMLKKRGFLTVFWILGAAIVAGIVILIF